MDPTRIDFVLYSPSTPTSDKNNSCGFDCCFCRPIQRNLLEEFDEVASSRRSIKLRLMYEVEAPAPAPALVQAPAPSTDEMDPTRFDFVLYSPSTPTPDKNNSCGFDCCFCRPIQRNLMEEFDEVASPRRSIKRRLMYEVEAPAPAPAPALVPAPAKRRRY